jgi:hypothetical protein
MEGVLYEYRGRPWTGRRDRQLNSTTVKSTETNNKYTIYVQHCL